MLFKNKPIFKFLTVLTLLIFLASCASGPRTPQMHIWIDKFDNASAKKAILAAEDINQYDKFGRTALHLAALRNNQEIVEFLLENGADINRKSFYGNTALSLSMRYADFQIAELLLASGADLDTENQTTTPLIESIKFKRADMSRKLMRAGADIDAIDKRNATALHYAASLGYTVLLDDLISMGADVNITAIDGMSPIHTAAFSENKAAVEILLSKGARIYPIEDNEKGAYSTAMLYTYVAQILESNGQPDEALAVYHKALKYNDTATKRYDKCISDLDWQSLKRGMAILGAFAGAALFGMIFIPIVTPTYASADVKLDFFSEDTHYLTSGYSALNKIHPEYFEKKNEKTKPEDANKDGIDTDEIDTDSDENDTSFDFETIRRNIYKGLSKQCALQSKQCTDKIDHLSKNTITASAASMNNETLPRLDSLESTANIDDEWVNLYVYRQYRFVASGALITCFIDDGYYSNLKCNTYSVKKVKPGKHQIKIAYNAHLGVAERSFIDKTFDIEEGCKDYYVRVIYGTDSPISVVSKEVAEEEMGETEDRYAMTITETMQNKIYQ